METREIPENEETAEPVSRASLQPGQVLRSRYQILRVLGTGGMSAVYEARDQSFPNVMRLCAIKEITISSARALSSQSHYQAALEREVNILASLSHPAIPKIYDYFVEGSHSYLVLELIHGQNLETFLAQSAGPLPDRMVARWAIEICDVLQYLHGRNPEPLVFRDMKPSNVMLNEHGHIVLIDFGIAKVFRSDKQRGTMIGTEGYSPPEQYRGEATPQGDIYALGATLHHLLTARDPTKEAPFSFQERPIHQFNPTVMPSLETIVDRSLAYDAKDRFASVGEMKAALEAVLESAGASASPATVKPAEEEIETVWSFQCEDEIRSSPRIGNDTVYIGCYDNNLYALDRKSGEFRWKYPTEGGIAATPEVWQDLILIGSEDFFMHAVSARTGLVNWTCQTKGRIRSSARIAYEHAFFGSDEGCIYAVQARTGRVVWKSPVTGPVRSTPVIGAETLFVGCQDAHVYALNLRRGSLQWRHHCGGGVSSSPIVWENLLIVGSTDHSVYALDVNSGWPIWRYRTEEAIISSPALSEDMVYIGSADHCLYALEVTAGRLRWKYETGGQVSSSPAISGDAVYAGSGDGCIYSVDKRTGKVRWKYQTGGPVVSSPFVYENLVYVGSLDGWLYALPV